MPGRQEDAQDRRSEEQATDDLSDDARLPEQDERVTHRVRRDDQEAE
jgi:hypothetical protein